MCYLAPRCRRDSTLSAHVLAVPAQCDGAPCSDGTGVSGFWDLSRAHEFQTPHSTPLTILIAAIGIPATCRFGGHWSVRGFATAAGSGENRGAAVVLLLPSCCGIAFLFSRVPSTQAHSRGSVWNRGRALGCVGRGQGLLTALCVSAYSCHTSRCDLRKA